MEWDDEQDGDDVMKIAIVIKLARMDGFWGSGILVHGYGYGNGIAMELLFLFSLSPIHFRGVWAQGVFSGERGLRGNRRADGRGR